MGEYNPLVIYGPSGTGKSHLALGLAAACKNVHPRKAVIYTVAVDFARELNDALETQDIEELRARYRHARLVIFEDVGELAGKPAAQQELVGTLDALLAAGGRMVITASAAPAELNQLIPVLRSRLGAGLTVPLSLPEPDTRLAIVRRLAKLRKMELEEPVARILADGLSVTVPELLGALVQLDAAARLLGTSVDAEAARNYLTSHHAARRPALREIGSATARYFRLKLSDLRSPSRRRTVVTARGVAMYLARRMTGKSLDQIGAYFGRRDHTTVMHGCRKTEHLLKSDPAIQQAVGQLQKKWQDR